MRPLDDARPLWNEHSLDRLLIAADLARKVTPIEAGAELMRALRIMDEERVDALPVVETAKGGAAIGVVTRADLGRFLLHHCARRQKAGPAGRR